ncbi:alkaline phosphatase family protein [Nocardia stercoris]|uniref:phospholipase C n=1 Tax=Nocardia stercoris TaxID=2483361 RepID=A0A3M2L214_9NOCA|nr:alkaline phosphatase family protein [Nocardia stercoris]RMI31424.1 acid phosphatase [Nocardia stercoris]
MNSTTFARRAAVCAASVALAAGALLGLGATEKAAAVTPPAYDHVVVAVFENHSYSEVVGGSATGSAVPISGSGGAAAAPYLSGLAAAGANFTQSFAIEHPSQPNYLDLFSGSNQGVTSDNCPQSFTGVANLGSDLIGAGKTFTGYSEAMPSDGYTGCSSGTYYRKHNPWVNFDNVPAASNRTFAAFPQGPAADFTTLPTVSFVVPDICNDMHDCSVSTGDTWAKNHLDAYAQWAKTHNSLLIVTFDEDDISAANQIPTIFYGAGVTTGNYPERINHFSVLRTLEDMYGLPHNGSAAAATPITDAFGAGPGPTTTPTTTGSGSGALPCVLSAC